MSLKDAMNANPCGFNLHCQKCGECIVVTPDAASKPVKCPKCGEMIQPLPGMSNVTDALTAVMDETAKRLGFDGQ